MNVNFPVGNGVCSSWTVDFFGMTLIKISSLCLIPVHSADYWKLMALKQDPLNKWYVTKALEGCLCIILLDLFSLGFQTGPQALV